MKTEKLVGAIAMLMVAAWFATSAPVAIAQQDKAAATAKCAEGQELDDDGLCYPACPNKFKGEGDKCVTVCAANSQDFPDHCANGPAIFRKKRIDRGPGKPPQ